MSFLFLLLILIGIKEKYGETYKYFYKLYHLDKDRNSIAVTELLTDK